MFWLFAVNLYYFVHNMYYLKKVNDCSLWSHDNLNIGIYNSIFFSF